MDITLLIKRLTKIGLPKDNYSYLAAASSATSLARFARQVIYTCAREKKVEIKRKGRWRGRKRRPRGRRRRERRWKTRKMEKSQRL